MRTLIAPLEKAYNLSTVCFFLPAFGIYGEPIYTFVASDGAIPSVYHEMDYSSIVREWNEQLIAYHFNESLVELLSYSLETHACEFLKT